MNEMDIIKPENVLKEYYKHLDIALGNCWKSIRLGWRKCEENNPD